MRLVVRRTLFPNFLERGEIWTELHDSFDQLHSARVNHRDIRDLLRQRVCDFAVLLEVDCIDVHFVGVVAQLFVLLGVIGEARRE